MILKWHNLCSDDRSNGNILYCRSIKEDPSNNWVLEVHVIFPPFGCLHLHPKYMVSLKMTAGEDYV